MAVASPGFHTKPPVVDVSASAFHSNHPPVHTYVNARSHSPQPPGAAFQFQADPGHAVNPIPLPPKPKHSDVAMEQQMHALHIHHPPSSHGDPHHQQPQYSHPSSHHRGGLNEISPPIYATPSHPPQPLHSGTHSGIPSAKNLERQKDDEIHLLRMLTNEKDAQIRKLERDLTQCHTELKHLNTLLAEKKEDVLKYQERISDMQSDNAELRQQLLGFSSQSSGRPSDAALHAEIAQLRQQVHDLRQRNEQLMGQRRASSDATLQAEVHHLRQNVADLQRRNDQLLSDQRRLSQVPLHPPPIDNPALQGEMQTLKQQNEFYQSERTQLLREMDTLQSKIMVLRHQVMTYNEDFQSERSDRERAQAQIQTLKDENESLKQAISLLAREHGIRLDAYGLEAH